MSSCGRPRPRDARSETAGAAPLSWTTGLEKSVAQESRPAPRGSAGLPPPTRGTKLGSESPSRDWSDSCIRVSLPSSLGTPSMVLHSARPALALALAALAALAAALDCPPGYTQWWVSAQRRPPR
jgi:hypothetical protein